MTASITTHVLDTSRGRPAAGVTMRLDIATRADGTDARWREIARGVTDADGRCRTLLADRPLEVATYRLTFDTGAYDRAQGRDGFFPEVSIVFAVRDATQHHHVPLLLSPFGFSTYRGS